MDNRPNIVYVIYHEDGSVKEVNRTEYQAKKKAGEMGLEWWPCVLTKIIGNSEPVDDGEHVGDALSYFAGAPSMLRGRE